MPTIFSPDEHWITRERAEKLRDEEHRKLVHLANIGRIVLALDNHGHGDFGDSALNDPILNIIDLGLPAHKLVRALASMSVERAAGLVRQGCLDEHDPNNENQPF